MLSIFGVTLVLYFKNSKDTQHLLIFRYQALKYRSVTDIVRPIREIVRRSEETTGHSVRPK
jgi:hypothetical protein